MPSYKALPLVAVLLYLIKIFYFKSDFVLMNATAVSGLLTAWTPILVIWGAIFLFRTMENTGELAVIKKWLNGVTENKIGQLMIIGWAFSFLIEGASGFGTPAALAAPLLMGLGFKPVRVAILTLIMNSVPVSFGAVGTPIWFGLGQIGLTESQLIEIGAKTAIIHGAAALVIPLIALRFVVSSKEIKQNIVFIYLSILGCTIPYMMLAQLNYEFPAIIGGAVGLILSVFFAKKGIGLKKSGRRETEKIPFGKIVKASFVLWGTIILLLITRIENFGIKDMLNSTAHSAGVNLSYIGEFLINPALVIRLNDIFGTGINWIHKTLYVPSIIPFFAISLMAFWIFGKGGMIKKTWNESWNQIKKPIIALLAALVFVNLLMADGEMAITVTIGKALASITDRYWQFFASYLGGLGAFFAGSNTVSNLTFAGIQQSISNNLGLNLTTILAAQSAGGAMGNMVCINNIVAVCSVLGIVNKEGYILKRTILPLIIYGVIAGIVTLGLSY